MTLESMRQRFTHGLLVTTLHEQLSDEKLATLMRDGAAMSEGQALRLATHVPERRRRAQGAEGSA